MADYRVGVCSWSLQPQSPGDLAEKITNCRVNLVQLALDPIRTGAWSEGETQDILNNAGITLASGMMAMKGENYSTLDTIRETGGVRLDESWDENLAAAHANAALAARLGLPLVTLHAGFIPHDQADPLRSIMIDRLRQIIDAFATHKITVAFETGQETTNTLRGALAELDRPTVGVNFDPANMILYAMGDPVAALRDLAPHIQQIHIKDAHPTNAPGTWGTETCAGTGAVDWDAFFTILHKMERPIDLIIEREAGGVRVDDVRTARSLIQRHLGSHANDG